MYKFLKHFNIRNHKYKILLLGAFASYPLYKPYVDYYTMLFKVKLHAQLQNDKPAPLAVESFGKQIVANILHDPQMKREGAIFVEELANKDIVVEGIVNLLTYSATDPHFNKEAKVFAKYLAHELFQDKVIEEDAIELVITLLRDPDVKHEVMELVKWMLQQESTRKEMVDLCRDSFQMPKMQNAVKDLMAFGFYEVLMDKGTVEKLKLFTSGLMEEGKQKADAKILIDQMIRRMVKSIGRVDNKDGELKKVLQGESRQESESSEDDKDEPPKEPGESGGRKGKKFYFF